MNSPPLTGTTVLSLEHAVAAPLCARQGELGYRETEIDALEKKKVI